MLFDVFLAFVMVGIMAIIALVLYHEINDKIQSSKDSVVKVVEKAERRILAKFSQGEVAKSDEEFSEEVPEDVAVSGAPPQTVPKSDEEFAREVAAYLSRERTRRMRGE